MTSRATRRCDFQQGSATSPFAAHGGYAFPTISPDGSCDTLLRVNLHWRDGVSSGLIKLAVGRCLIDVMDSTKWLELGTITGFRETIQGHPRLLRSLHFGDDDYDACVWEVLPQVLGEAAFAGGRADLTTLDVVAEFLDLPAWLATHDEPMFRRLYDVEDASAAVMADGTVMDAVETAAARLDVGEMRRQVTRIRRDYEGDPEAVIGASKELVETVCKTILGLTGDGDTREDVPKLVHRTLLHLGLDAATAADHGQDPTEAHALKRVLGGVSSILNGADELRNARGTGHGRSGSPLIDESLARLTVGLVLPAVIYLVEIYEQRMTAEPPPDSAEGQTIEPGSLVPGAIVRHPTFGEGQVLAVANEGHANADGLSREVLTVEFAPEVGVKNLLARYAPLEILQRR